MYVKENMEDRLSEYGESGMKMLTYLKGIPTTYPNGDGAQLECHPAVQTQREGKVQLLALIISPIFPDGSLYVRQDVGGHGFYPVDSAWALEYLFVQSFLKDIGNSLSYAKLFSPQSGITPRSKRLHQSVRKYAQLQEEKCLCLEAIEQLLLSCSLGINSEQQYHFYEVIRLFLDTCETQKSTLWTHT